MTCTREKPVMRSPATLNDVKRPPLFSVKIRSLAFSTISRFCAARLASASTCSRISAVCRLTRRRSA
ncbi:MAG: hypothetical protein BWX86_01007 [Verrucomicrobia bacterium ADurb.Bin122]|nr:MAG: hypothetical protein BWX86_01007 [Verrucomicrobia bacterium ADurb.Bin122]